MGRQGVSLHPHLLKDSCVALMKCHNHELHRLWDVRYNATNVSSVCLENARRHGAAVGALGMPDLNKEFIHILCAEPFNDLSEEERNCCDDVFLKNRCLFLVLGGALSLGLELFGLHKDDEDDKDDENKEDNELLGIDLVGLLLLWVTLRILLLLRSTCTDYFNALH